MSDRQERPRPGPNGGQFAAASHPQPNSSIGDMDALQAKREKRLPRTLDEMRVCFDDAAELVGRGATVFAEDPLIRRAARSIVADLAETCERLPERVRREKPDLPWAVIKAMRNTALHDYQDTDFEVVWDTLAVDLPSLRRSLGV